MQQIERRVNPGMSRVALAHDQVLGKHRYDPLTGVAMKVDKAACQADGIRHRIVKRLHRAAALDLHSDPGLVRIGGEPVRDITEQKYCIAS